MSMKNLIREWLSFHEIAFAAICPIFGIRRMYTYPIISMSDKWIFVSSIARPFPGRKNTDFKYPWYRSNSGIALLIRLLEAVIWRPNPAAPLLLRAGWEANWTVFERDQPIAANGNSARTKVYGPSGIMATFASAGSP